MVFVLQTPVVQEELVAYVTRQPQHLAESAQIPRRKINESPEHQEEKALPSPGRVEEALTEGMELWLGLESYTGFGHMEMGW